MRKLLLVSIFCAGFLGSRGQLPSTCEDISVEYKIEVTISGKWDLKVTATGEKSPYKYILCYEDGNLVLNEFDSEFFSEINPGEYWLIVTTSNGCHKKVKVNQK
jgi:hypothetical protein